MEGWLDRMLTGCFVVDDCIGLLCDVYVAPTSCYCFVSEDKTEAFSIVSLFRMGSCYGKLRLCPLLSGVKS